MDIRQLQMFKAVAELRGFTKAADKLYISHSAISRQIKLLEDELKTLLLVRKGREVSLTQSGRALFSYAENILQQIVEARQAVSAAAQEQLSRLHIGTATNILAFFLLPVLESFRRSFPNVSVLTTTASADKIVEEIRSGTINLGVMSTPVDARGLSVSPLYREEFVVVVAHNSSLARKKVLKIEELDGVPLITYTQGSALRRILDSFFVQRGITPNIRLEVENEEAVEKAVANNVGISFLSQRRAHDNKRITSLHISGHRIYRDVALVHATRAGKLPESVTQFEGVCREHLASFSNNRFIRPLPDS